MKLDFRKLIILTLLCVALCSVLSGCSKIYYYFTDAVSFKLENETGQEIYAASVYYGTKDTVFGSVSVENADGTALSNKGKECPVIPFEEGDLINTKLEDMIFDFYVRTQKDSDFVYVGRGVVTSSKLHQTYTLTISEKDGKLTINSDDTRLDIMLGE